MRCLPNSWLKTACVAAMLGAAPFVSNLTPAFADDADEQAPRPEQRDRWIGVGCADVPAPLRAQLDLPEGQGVLIDEVVADGPAQRAGLKAFDVIVAADGKPIADLQALAAAVARGKGEIQIDYLRAGKKQSVSVKPAPRPESLGVPQRDQRAIRQWVERLGRGPAPMNFRFFHPGLVLPPGASIAPDLPDDMTVTIEKRGQQPAKATAKQGDKRWEASEESLEKLPPEARRFAERMLGLGMFEPMADGPAVLPPAGWPSRPDAADSRLDRRLENLERQIDELRKSVEKQRFKE